jgi:NADH-quinone oxidoreductase subunit A
MTGYGYIALFLIVALGFTTAVLVLPQVFKKLKLIPDNPGGAKNEPYESGIPTIGRTWIQFNFRYYYYALVFLALDVMVLFVYPWAAEIRNLGGQGFLILLVFILLIVTGYIYAWKKKALEWK